MCGFCNVWVCVCVGFVMCVCVCVCVGFVMCGCVCVCVGFVMCGCVCVGFVLCVCLCFLYCFTYVYLFLFVLSVLVSGLLPPCENSIAVCNNNNNKIEQGIEKLG